MATEIVKVKTVTEHPLEDVFDIAPNSTTKEVTTLVHEDSIEDVSYDDKDLEIEQQFDEIYQLALGGMASLADEVELVEGKYKARISEVAVANLQVALNAAKEKAGLKAHKDKTTQVKQTNNNITNNNLVMTQADIVKMLKE